MAELNPGILAERLVQLGDRLDRQERRADRFEENLQSLLAMPLLLQQVQQAVTELKASVAESQRERQTREQWLESMQETRGSNLRSTGLTLISLFVAVVSLLISSVITIGLKLAGK